MANKRRPHIADGSGKSIPPLRDFVLIYFDQKGRTISEALEFLKYYNNNGWASSNGEAIRDWKATANSWIWRLIQMDRLQQLSYIATKPPLL